MWLAKAPGEVDVALKIVSQLNRAQGRQEFKSLERYKNLKHNSLCKVFAFWLVELPENDQAEGKVLKHDEISSEFESAFEPRAGATDETVAAEPDDAGDQELDGTIRPPSEDWGGRETPLVGSGSSTERGGGTPSWATESGAEGRDRGLIRLIIAMQLGDMTLMDKLEECQRGADQAPAKPGNHGIPQKASSGTSPRRARRSPT